MKEVSPRHDANAATPTSVTESGSITEVTLVQSNALLPIVVTESAIVTEVKLSQQ